MLGVRSSLLCFLRSEFTLGSVPVVGDDDGQAGEARLIAGESVSEETLASATTANFSIRFVEDAAEEDDRKSGAVGTTASDGEEGGGVQHSEGVRICDGSLTLFARER